MGARKEPVPMPIVGGLGWAGGWMVVGALQKNGSFVRQNATMIVAVKIPLQDG